MSFPKFVKGLALVLAVASIGATSAYAAKPGSSANAPSSGKPSSSSYAPTLGVSWPLSAASTASSDGTPYVVAGCGYNGSYGGVTIVVRTPVAMAFAGQIPDSNGCISLSNFSSQGAGHYEIDAYQTIRNKATQVASTSFTL
jgi:hypothetical protein